MKVKHVTILAIGCIVVVFGIAMVLNKIGIF